MWCEGSIKIRSENFIFSLCCTGSVWSCRALFLEPDSSSISLPSNHPNTFPSEPKRVGTLLCVVWGRGRGGGPTCLPIYRARPRWGSRLNSSIKTHYRAISSLIMLSNDLISLSVSPVSHRRLLWTLAARRCTSVGSFLLSGIPAAWPPGLIKNRIERSISENVSRQND